MMRGGKDIYHQWRSANSWVSPKQRFGDTNRRVFYIQQDLVRGNEADCDLKKAKSCVFSQKLIGIVNVSLRTYSKIVNVGHFAKRNVLQ